MLYETMLGIGNLHMQVLLSTSPRDRVSLFRTSGGCIVELQQTTYRPPPEWMSWPGWEIQRPDLCIEYRSLGQEVMSVQGHLPSNRTLGQSL